jgi:hypothetical protein
MEVEYTEEDALKRFRYPKWVVGFSLFVLAIFAYSLTNISDLIALTDLRNQARKAFNSKNYSETNRLIDVLDAQGVRSPELLYLRAGCAFGLKDTAIYDGALHLLKVVGNSTDAHDKALLNDILKEQGYSISILNMLNFSIVTLNDSQTGKTIKTAR